MGVPVGTKCAPLVADCVCLVLRETSCCLPGKNQTDVLKRSFLYFNRPISR